jgi:hypothetical protein
MKKGRFRKINFAQVLCGGKEHGHRSHCSFNSVKNYFHQGWLALQAWTKQLFSTV